MTAQGHSAAGQAWIARLGLEAHPEGGWFRRLYTSPSDMMTPAGNRASATSIHYLLTAEQPRGQLHGNRSDILHFLIDGGPVEYLLAAPGQPLRRVRLSRGIDGEHFLLVPGGCWKASQLVQGATHALVAEVVTPGFDYADHRFATLADVERDCPQSLEVLRWFCK